jgi:hypothetical protein
MEKSDQLNQIPEAVKSPQDEKSATVENTDKMKENQSMDSKPQSELENQSKESNPPASNTEDNTEKVENPISSDVQESKPEVEIPQSVKEKPSIDSKESSVEKTEVEKEISLQEEAKTETKSPEVESKEKSKSADDSPQLEKEEAVIGKVETSSEVEEKPSVDSPETLKEEESQPEIKKDQSEETEEVKASKEEKVSDEPKEEAADEELELKKEATESEESSDDKKEDKTPPEEVDANDEESDEEDEDEEEEEDESHLEQQYDLMNREELVNNLDELLQAENINKIKTKVALIKVTFLKKNKEEKQSKLNAFLEDGGNKEDYKPEQDLLEERFSNAFKVYKEKRKAFLEEQEKIKQENLVKKHETLEKLRELINSEESLAKTYEAFKELQEQWKEIGMVPKAEISTLWQSYNFLVEKFFDKVKINKELKDLDLKKNLEAKIKMCEKAEQLLIESSINKSFKELQKYHQEWKDIGPVPTENNDEIWERFKAATDKINERRKEYYEKLAEDQKNNLMAKTALCEKAEEILAKEIKSIKEWQEETKQINELMKVWKTLGPAPKNVNDEIWERFRGSMNSFYENKQEYFNKLKEEQINNYNLKINLCVEAEAIQNSTDWRNTTADFLKLQEEWKKIGPVPRKNSDAIWKRFRAACDIFFNAKSDYFSNIDKHEEENMKKKEELIKKVKEFEFGEDKKENLKAVNELQREFMNIGHVPMKHKNRLQNEFREAVNSRLDELKIKPVEISTMNYKSRIDSIKDSPEAKRNLFREKTQLGKKISQLQNDINLWENNLGFFANSKNADVLKMEVEKKIKKAKDELVILEAKMKYIKAQG